MDTITAFLQKESAGKLNIAKFMLTGGSKVGMKVCAALLSMYVTHQLHYPPCFLLVPNLILLSLFGSVAGLAGLRQLWMKELCPLLHLYLIF